MKRSDRHSKKSKTFGRSIELLKDGRVSGSWASFELSKVYELQIFLFSIKNKSENSSLVRGQLENTHSVFKWIKLFKTSSKNWIERKKTNLWLGHFRNIEFVFWSNLSERLRVTMFLGHVINLGGWLNLTYEVKHEKVHIEDVLKEGSPRRFRMPDGALFSVKIDSSWIAWWTMKYSMTIRPVESLNYKDR